jgi:hypothetical protein
VAISPYVPAEGALLPNVSRTPQELGAANVAHSFMDNAGFLVGSIATGALLGLASAEAAMAMAAVAGLLAWALLLGLSRDARPDYAEEAAHLLAESVAGARALFGDDRLRLVGIGLTLLVFFEGAADVLIVLLALELLGLGEENVGYINAAWGVGALLAGGALAVLLDRGKMAVGLLVGSAITGVAMALPGLWVVPAAAYLAGIGIGIGYTAVEVAARTLLQRIGEDETLARSLAFIETSRFAAMALGSVAAPALVVWISVEGALLAFAAVLPLFALVNLRALRKLEIGAPIDPARYELLRSNQIFRPLPVETLEAVARSVQPLQVEAGETVISEGDHGDRFYLIVAGEVVVTVRGSVRRHQGRGESFGEIALLRDVLRTATVRATGFCELLCLDREHFIAAVTGHVRSREAAHREADERISNDPQLGAGPFA